MHLHATEQAGGVETSYNEPAFVALGSNLDEPVKQVEKGLVHLDAAADLRVVACSGLYASDPMGPENQPAYINAVCEIATTLSPLQLLETLLAIESDRGRKRDTGRWGPRVLDLDLLLFGQRILRTPRLTVPHPGMLERSFVLLPLLEIAPGCIVPGKGAASLYRESVIDNDIKRIGDLSLVSARP